MRTEVPLREDEPDVLRVLVLWADAVSVFIAAEDAERREEAVDVPDDEAKGDKVADCDGDAVLESLALLDDDDDAASDCETVADVVSEGEPVVEGLPEPEGLPELLGSALSVTVLLSVVEAVPCEFSDAMGAIVFEVDAVADAIDDDVADFLGEDEKVPTDALGLPDDFKELEGDPDVLAVLDGEREDRADIESNAELEEDAVALLGFEVEGDTEELLLA